MASSLHGADPAAANRREVMETRGNVILITGGGSGIGRGLAEAFHALGNQVVIAGRRREVLASVAEANPGMAFRVLDVQDPAAVRAFGPELARDFPALNVLVNNGGIMRAENLLEQPEDLADLEATVATNLLGPLRLTAALLPLLRQQARSTVLNVSSGLAFLPLALTPTYCATKAAVHSWTQSLRFQLRDTTTEVLELIPPYVATDLMNGASDPRAMPLGTFLEEVMALLATPGLGELCVENVKRLRFAAEGGHYGEAFQGFNELMARHPV
jgi:uncharacterized oxidoreductase